jgi:hypothetical protein
LSDPRVHITEDEAIANFAISLSSAIGVISEAVRVKMRAFARDQGGDEYVWPMISDIYKDSATVQVGGKVYECSWTWNGGDITVGDPKPAAAPFADETVTREAKIFEAGEYPDKNLTVTEDDLDTIVSNFAPDTVPVKIEHESTPFDGKLGNVVKLWRQGRDLMGKITFPKATWELIESASAKKLSAGVLRTKTGLSEVSIVSNPRVATAQVFHDTEAIAYFSADFPAGEPAVPIQPAKPAAQAQPTMEVVPMAGVTTPSTVDVATALRVLGENIDTPAVAEFVKSNNALLAMVQQSNQTVIDAAKSAQAVAAEFKKMQALNLVERFKREGKILPAAEVFARAILEVKPVTTGMAVGDAAITFKDGDGTEKTAHFAELFVAFLDAMEPAINFKQILAASEGDPTVTAEQSEFFKGLGVDPKAAAANMR